MEDRSNFAFGVLCLVSIVGIASAMSDYDAYELLNYAREYTLEALPAEVSDGERQIIEFWLDADVVDDESKCSVEYLRQLKAKIEEHKQSTDMFNVMALYDSTEHDLLSKCGDRVAHLGRELVPLFDERHGAIKMVAVEFNLWLHQTDNSDAAMRPLAEWMLMSIGTENGAEQDRFFEAWRHGKCAAILDTVSKEHMQPFVNFIAMLDETQRNPYKIHSIFSGLHASIVQCCRYFQSDEALTRAWNGLRKSTLYRSVRKNSDDARSSSSARTSPCSQ